MRDVQITAVANGWVVQVGCQRFVYNDRSALIVDLSDYMTDPIATEKRIMEKAVNAKYTMRTPVPGAEVAPTPHMDYHNERLRNAVECGAVGGIDYAQPHPVSRGY
jgi:hypothetical protein